MAAAQVPNTPIRRLLESVKVTSLINPQRDLLILSPDEEIGAAFEKIVHRRLISAPVYDKHLKQYVGFLDVKDLVSLVVFKEEERKKAEQQPHLAPSGSGPSSLEPPKADFRQVFDVAAKMYARPEQGVTITYLARRHGFHAVKDSDTLLHVVELLSRHDVHRVPVLEAATGRLLDIVSQSTVAKWLDQHADAPEVAAALGRTVESAPQLGTANPQCALDTDIALDVFKTMSAHNRSGMAIVDETGRFLGNTSGSDLKLLLHGYQHAHALLHGNIFDFQAAVRQADVVDHYPTIAVSRHDTVRHLVQKICATHVHRIFVADGDHGYKPERVVSITDVFRYLLADGAPATAEAPQIRVVSD